MAANIRLTTLNLLMVLTRVRSCSAVLSNRLAHDSLPWFVSQSPEAVPQEVSSTKEVPVVHTETKTITYEAAEVHIQYDLIS